MSEAISGSDFSRMSLRSCGLRDYSASTMLINRLRELFAQTKNKPVPDDGPVTVADILNRGWLELFYQPKIELKSRRLVGAEGLVRTRHPVRGMISPGEFLPSASEADMLALTERVIVTALMDWKRSEEHTSELQSRQYLVCRLLLEKKKKAKSTTYADKNTHKLIATLKTTESPKTKLKEYK